MGENRLMGGLVILTIGQVRAGAAAAGSLEQIEPAEDNAIG